MKLLIHAGLGFKLNRVSKRCPRHISAENNSPWHEYSLCNLEPDQGHPAEDGWQSSGMEWPLCLPIPHTQLVILPAYNTIYKRYNVFDYLMFLSKWLRNILQKCLPPQGGVCLWVLLCGILTLSCSEVYDAMCRVWSVVAIMKAMG